MLRPVKKTSLAGSVFEQIRDLIVSGELSAGDHLPAERQLSETLGVNRSAVREALKRLEQAGLIVIQHGGATRVLDPMVHAGPSLLPALLNHDASHADDLDGFLRALLPDLCRSAALRARSSDVARLQMLRDLHGAQPSEDLRLAFFRAIVDASGNRVARLVFNRLAPVWHPPEPKSGRMVELCNAIAAKDSRGAALTARELLESR